MLSLERTPDLNITERVSSNLVNRLVAGSEFPEVTLTRYNSLQARENFSTKAELAGRSVVIFTVPGAYTPTCTSKHLSSFKDNARKILDLGIDKIICICPNNVDVVHAWNAAHGDPSIDMWADNLGELTDKMGLGLNLSGNRGMGYGLVRSAMVVKNRTVEWIQIEDSPANVVASHADSVIKQILSTSEKAPVGSSQ
jgi:peroxiredoxin